MASPTWHPRPTAALFAGLLLPLFAPAGPAAAEPVTVRLAGNGLAAHQVVVAPAADDRVRETAAELALYLGRISGASFTVTEGDGTTGLALGVFSDFPALETGVEFCDANPFRREEYLLRTHDAGAWLIGATSHAVVNAAWDFLHRLGYRLYFLTDTWEIVPDRPDLHLAVDAFAAPDFITRQAPRGAPRDAGDLGRRWRDRNRVTPAFNLRTGHAYGAIIRANRDAFDANPEFYALVDGRREHRGGNTKFCIASPGLRALVVDHAVRTIEADPDRESISMDPSDGGGWCQCDPCAAMGSVSDRVVILANEVAAAINNLGRGDKYVGIYAYAGHSPPPAVEVHPKVVVSIATAFIRGGHTLEDLVTGWSARGATLGVREYLSVFPWWHSMPRRARGGDIAYLARTITFFHEHRARFMNACGASTWGPDGLGLWLLPIMLWDVSAVNRLDDYVEDFLANAFGAAAGPMRDFYHLLNFDRTPRPPADVTGRLYRALAAARPLTGDPAVHARLDDLVLYTRYTELYHEYRAASGAARQAGFEAIWRHAYRMRDRFLLATESVCHRERFRDDSVKLPPDVDWHTPEEEHPWKSSAPFTAAELAAIVEAGIAANPIVTLDFQPREFSEELVPAAGPLGLPEVPTGDFGRDNLFRGRQTLFTWFDQPGQPLELTVSGGRVWRDRGPVRFQLYSPLEETLAPVDQDGNTPPDRQSHPVTLRSPHAGLHRLDWEDGDGRTRVHWPENQPATIRSCLEEPARLEGNRHLYFYVPRGTEIVGGYTSHERTRILDGEGNTVLDWGEVEGGAGYFSIPVPPGQDGTLWSFRRTYGRQMLMTVPPWLARNAAELLLPAEVVARDAPARADGD